MSVARAFEHEAKLAMEKLYGVADDDHDDNEATPGLLVALVADGRSLYDDRRVSKPSTI